MSPYERQIEPLEAVDVNFVLGVPGQATSSPDETMEPLLSAPLSAQRLNAHDVTSETLPTASALLAEAGIHIGVPATDRLGYDSSLGYDTGSYAAQLQAAQRYAATERDTELLARLEDPGDHSSLVPPPATGLDTRRGLGLGSRRLGLATVALAVCAALGAAVSIAAYGDADGPSAGQVARANGVATSQVLAEDLGVGLGAYAPGGLPVTLTNTAHEPLAYNVSVEALDAAGRRVTADTAFVGTLAPGQSSVVTMFANATGGLAAELAGAQFHIVEASAY